jgi:hypothetical protein
MGSDATIDTVIVSITNAKNLGPSGAGAKFKPCPEFTTLLVLEFILVEDAEGVGNIVCCTELLGSGA